MARSALARVFSRLDLPEFGTPIRTTSAPVDNNSPGLERFIRSLIIALSSLIFFLITLCSISPTGSSEKSIFASTITLNDSIFFEIHPISFEKLPLKDLKAQRAATSV